MSKRGENIYKRKDGRWEGRMKENIDFSGSYRYRSVYGKTYKEVKEKMNAMKQAPADNLCQDTVEQAAWLFMQTGKNDWKAGTYTAYYQLLKKYVLPHLGNMKLKEINSRKLENFSILIKEETKENPLSKNYLSQICEIVRRIIIYMNKRHDQEIPVPVNPITKTHLQQTELPSESSLMILEEYLFAHCIEDTCLGVLMAFHTGIRIGELSALKWGDIDMEENMIYIRHNLLRVREEGIEDSIGKHSTQVIEQSPKTIDSVRAIPIPPRLVPLIVKYRKEDSMYVISGEKKPWAEPRTIQYRFKKILHKCDIQYFNFHLLRHAFATRCVSKGLDLKSLSEILGHSNIQMTLNLYVHSTIQQKKRLMELYDAIPMSRQIQGQSPWPILENPLC